VFIPEDATEEGLLDSGMVLGGPEVYLSDVPAYRDRGGVNEG
jgi:hypothetical protein